MIQNQARIEILVEAAQGYSPAILRAEEEIMEPSRIVAAVWDSCGMISSSGFSGLLENDVDFNVLTKCYLRIGLQEFKSLVERFVSLLPAHCFSEPFEQICEQFEDLTEDELIYNKIREIDREYYNLTSGDRLVDLLIDFMDAEGL